MTHSKRSRKAYVPQDGDFGVLDQTLGHDLTSPQLTLSDKYVNVRSVFCEVYPSADSSSTLARSSLQVASSAALSPPPITANGLFRKIGTAPSQTAHAEIPDCQ
jgi:hypothetical protein